MNLGESRTIGFSKKRKIAFWILPVVFAIFTLGDNARKISIHNVELNNSIHTGRTILAKDADCVPPAINDFPPDFLTQKQRLLGGVVFHILISCFMCYALAVVCDEYFVPSLEKISGALNIPSDVAGATFMAAGTSAPELFTSVVGAFITEGDIGIGTIVGSAVFNILAVVSVCGLLAGKVVELDWWPLTRDCLSYTITVIALIFLLADEEVYWYEALVLLGLFCLYITLMFFNTKAERLAHRLVQTCLCCQRKPNDEKKSLLPSHHEHRIRTYSTQSDQHSTSDIEQCSTTKKLRVDSESKDDLKKDDKIVDNGVVVHIEKNKDETHEKPKMHEDANLDRAISPCKEVEEGSQEGEPEEDMSPFRMPKGNKCQHIVWILIWPASFIFYITIPDCRKQRWQRLFPVTFGISVFYIGALSYLLAWMVTIIGHTFNIPDTVMGLTFLAAGTSVPEAISSVIVTRQGFGNMAISNSVGSNVFDILFCLGLPWFIKSLSNNLTGYSVHINSKGLEYSVIALLTTVVVMFGSVAANGFRLDKRVGVACLIMYATFLTVSSLFELNVFGIVNLPTCLD